MGTNRTNILRLIATCLMLALVLVVARTTCHDYELPDQLSVEQERVAMHEGQASSGTDNLDAAGEHDEAYDVETYEQSEDTSVQSQASYEFEAPAPMEESPRLTIEEGVTYEPQTVLLSVAEGASIEEVNELIAQTESVATHEVSAEELQSGLIMLEVTQGSSVEDAMNDLVVSDVAMNAQPDYIYYALQGDEYNLRARLAESIDPQVDEVLSSTAEGSQTEAQVSLEAENAETQECASETEDAQAGSSHPFDESANTEQQEDESLNGNSYDEEAASLDESANESNEVEVSTDIGSLADDLESLIPNDRFVEQQWALTRMRVYEAWAYATCDGKVGIAIMDEGPDSSHRDLVGTVRDSYDVYAQTTEPSILVEHGTHVSGIVGATTNNGIGIAGVSHNAAMVLLNVFYERSMSSGITQNITNTSTLVQAYEYLIEHRDTLGVRVVNLSLGVKKSSKSTYSDDALVSRINDAFESGIVTVAASGNSDLGNPPYYEYPGDAQNVVSVMNLKQTSTGVDLSTTSNYNVNGQTDKNICAPGTSITSTTLNNGYATLSGTSMAAPHVSGVLALEFAANPDLTAQEAVNILYSTARDLGDEGWDREFGWGEVDACAAVKAAKEGTHTELPDISNYEIPEPEVEGPTRMPVGAIATFKVKNGSLKIKTGKSAATLDGTTLTGMDEGIVTLSVIDNAGVEQTTRNVVIYESTGCWVLSPAENKSYVLDVKGGSVLNSANVQLYTSNGKNNQVWLLELQSDGSFVIRSGKSGKVLDVSGASKKSGGNVIQYAPSGKAWQKWQMLVNADNSLTFINVNSSMALEIAKAAANSVNVRQGTKTGKTSQRWVLRSVSADIGTIWDGVYKVASSLNKSYVLDVKGASTSNSGNVQIYRANGNDNQRWRFEYLGKGVYKIVNVNSGKVLDVARGTLKNSVNIDQWSWNGGSNQRWELEAYSNGTYAILRAGTSWAVDVKGAKAENSRNVHQYQSKGNKAQRWYLTQY